MRRMLINTLLLALTSVLAAPANAAIIKVEATGSLGWDIDFRLKTSDGSEFFDIYVSDPAAELMLIGDTEAEQILEGRFEAGGLVFEFLSGVSESFMFSPDRFDGGLSGEFFWSGTFSSAFGPIVIVHSALFDNGEIISSDTIRGTGACDTCNPEIDEHEGSFDLKSFRYTEVPEPGTLALLGAGLIGMGFTRRRKAA